MERSVNISIALVDDLKIRQRRENELLGICPVCGCQDANFNTAKLKWRCWHCPAKGIIIPEDGYEVKEVEEKVLDIPKVRELYSNLTDKYHQDITQQAVDYLTGRGLTQQTIDSFKLGFCSTNFYNEYSSPLAEDAGLIFREYPALTNRITIPYMVDGQTTDLRGRILNGITYRDNTPTYVSLSGNHASRGATFLFNHDIISKSNRIIVTEGEFKAIVGVQYGFPMVATPGIFGWQKEWSKLLKGKEVILAADFDRISGLRSPAYLMAKALLAEIPQLKVALLAWGAKTSDSKIDVDSLLSNGHLKTFDRAVNGAVEASWFLRREETYGYVKRK